MQFQDFILKVSFLSLVQIPPKQSLKQGIGLRHFNGDVVPRSISRNSGWGIGQEENSVKGLSMEMITSVCSFSPTRVPVSTLQKASHYCISEGSETGPFIHQLSHLVFSELILCTPLGCVNARAEWPPSSRQKFFFFLTFDFILDNSSLAML